jgi:hypothetical protein
MNTSKQQALRQLAEEIAKDSSCRQLAEGTRELLQYTAELEQTLQAVMADCCEAMYLTYEYGAQQKSPQQQPLGDGGRASLTGSSQDGHKAA